MDDDRARLAAELKLAISRAVAPPTVPRREVPMSFTAALLAAIVAGRKTETRRPIRPAPADVTGAVAPVAAGDRMWVREAWSRLPAGGFEYPRDGRTGGRPSPARFMPRDAARLFLTVTDVSASRLATLDEAAAIAEGFVASPLGNVAARDAFLSTWDAIYGADAFASANDPWVWVIRFRPEK